MGGKIHLLAFLSGFLLDLLLGDPYWLPHPIRGIGKWIQFCEKRLLHTEEQKSKRRRGVVLVAMVLLPTGLVAAFLLGVSYRIGPFFGFLVEVVMTEQILATKCLRVESMKVYQALQAGDLLASRKAVSWIVGRDTDALDEEGVMKATIETIAENTSDGSIAPIFYTLLFGPVFGWLYKAINTMDSMVGYHNERYEDFGKAAAKLDDVVNFLPSRLSACLMIGSCLFLGPAFSARRAYSIWRRDRRKHASPNSAQTESVCAGALGIRLAGDACYGGRLVKKPFIGDAWKRVERKDIVRANQLLYATAILAVVFLSMLLFVVTVI